MVCHDFHFTRAILRYTQLLGKMYQNTTGFALSGPKSISIKFPSGPSALVWISLIPSKFRTFASVSWTRKMGIATVPYQGPGRCCRNCGSFFQQNMIISCWFATRTRITNTLTHCELGKLILINLILLAWLGPARPMSRMTTAWVLVTYQTWNLSGTPVRHQDWAGLLPGRLQITAEPLHSTAKVDRQDSCQRSSRWDWFKSVEDVFFLHSYKHRYIDIQYTWIQQMWHIHLRWYEMCQFLTDLLSCQDEEVNSAACVLTGTNSAHFQMCHGRVTWLIFP